MAYSDFLDRALYHLECLDSLKPSDVPDAVQLELVRGASMTDLAGEAGLEERARLVRALLLWAHGDLTGAHRLAQDASGDLAAYLHGMIHRREQDFENARYWFGRAGVLPFFAEVQRQGAAVSEDVAKQLNWDPYLFTTLCERSKHGARTPMRMLVDLQKIEFRTMLDYVYRAG